MAIVFTAPERLAITRRQLRIQLENAAFTMSLNSFANQQAQLLSVDNSNAIFYYHYNEVCQAYEAEANAINGTVSDVYAPSDVTTQAQNPTVAPFFPSSPVPVYEHYIPLILSGSFTNNKVKGFFHPTSTDADNEQQHLSDLTSEIDLIKNGFNDGSGGDTGTISIPAGVITGFNLTVGSVSGFNPGSRIVAYNGSASGIYLVTAVASLPTPTLTIDSIVPTAIGISSPAVSNVFPGFNNATRTSMVSGSYQEILDSLASIIDSLVSSWEARLVDQTTQLNANDDDRATQLAQISAAVMNVFTANLAINVWQALPSSGATGRFTDASLSPLETVISSRTSQSQARVSQITTALGTNSANSLSQSGNSFTSADPTNPYFSRYNWLNIRINRLMGSLRRYYQAQQSQSSVQMLKDNNDTILAEYDGYFVTQQITFQDGKDVVQVNDTSVFAVGDQLTLVSEDQPEVSVGVVEIMSPNEMRLTKPVPLSYQIDQLARLFKEV